MIESLSISKVATYPETPEIMNGLKSLNFIFGSNGTGKTTIGRVITTPSSSPGCGVTWKRGTPLQTLVYNSDFVERNFKSAEDLKGVFTLGEEQIGTLEKISELKLERETLTRKVERWNEALKGADGTGGKQKDLSNLDSSFKDKCWGQKVKHDSKLQGAFEGVRNNSEKFKDRLLENTINTSALLTLNELEKRAETVFGQTPVVEQLVRAIDGVSLLAHEANVILKKKLSGRLT